jgi:ferritin-like metal-binding protein YciE
MTIRVQSIFVIVIFPARARSKLFHPLEKQSHQLSKQSHQTSPSFVAGANVSLMQLETLKDLYIHELKDLYSAEQQLVKALPKMAKAAMNKELAAGFQEHLEQTKGHAQRLEQILSSHKQTSRGPKCKGMEGIVAEGAELIEEEADEEVKDAGLISAAQRVEHYEMAGYGTARTYADLLSDKEGANLLQMTLEEERATDQKLTKLAKSAINVAAAK